MGVILVIGACGIAAVVVVAVGLWIWVTVKAGSRDT
jgi:hypothetical protein